MSYSTERRIELQNKFLSCIDQLDDLTGTLIAATGGREVTYEARSKLKANREQFIEEGNASAYLAFQNIYRYIENSTYREQKEKEEVREQPEVAERFRKIDGLIGQALERLEQIEPSAESNPLKVLKKYFFSKNQESEYKVLKGIWKNFERCVLDGIR